VERLHQTLKRFLRKQPAATSLPQLQLQLDAFRAYYNSQRPHRALDWQTPIAGFNARLKAKPAPRPAPVDHRVRHDKVDRFGKLTLRHQGKLRHIRTAESAFSSPAPTAAAALKTVISQQFELANSICLSSTAATEQLLLAERADAWRVMAVRIVSQCADPPGAGVPGIRASSSSLELV